MELRCIGTEFIQAEGKIMLHAQIRLEAEAVSPAPLPPPELYEQEYTYWPWRFLIAKAQDYVAASALQGGTVLDYMCGTGFFLRGIFVQRPDLLQIGCDIHLPFVEFARNRHPSARIVHADARNFVPDCDAHVITCLSGLHHLVFADQEAFLEKVASECSPETIVIFGEEAIAEHENDAERRQATLKLNNELLVYGVKNEWPDSMINAAIDVMKNDILLRGEFKRSISSWRAMIRRFYTIVDMKMTWTPESGGGDILFFCKAKLNASRQAISVNRAP